jgi:hypothetical protein
MEKTYVIQWKSKSNGRTGIGTTLFDRQKAQQLAEELNRDYPEIEHQPLETQGVVHADASHLLPIDHPVSESTENRVLH